MPFPTPQTLTVDETYALTAYVLNLNDILPADAALDQDSLPKVKMPNRDGFTTDHGFMHRDGKPDTRNVACMKDCVKEVRLSSEFPVSELDSHGNLAEQTRSLGGTAGTGAGAPAPAAAPKAATAADLAKKSGCLACHAVANKVVGPSYKDIAAKYAGDAGAEGRLVAKVKAGGAGAWGQVPMPPHPQLSDADVRALVQWILGGAR
jgi:cytochrome c